jgi:nucleoside-diphosphate-sugar epimerase
MRVLVVGGNGFLGSHLINQLQEFSFSIMSLNRSVSPATSYKSVVANLMEPRSYESAIKDWKPNIVIQTAWITDIDSYRDSNRNSQYSQSTIRFAKFCYSQGVSHFLGLGSAAEYGDDEDQCIAGVTQTNPLDTYSHCKVVTSREIQDIALQYGGRFTWLRIFQPYGKFQDQRRLIPYIFKELQLGNSVTLNSPTNLLDWISARDIARAITHCLLYELEGFVDIGTGSGTTVLEIGSAICDLLGVSRNLLHYVDRPHKKITTRLVVGKRSPLLMHGWRANDSIDSGLRWALIE